jgi:hypothetical protein
MAALGAQPAFCGAECGAKQVWRQASRECRCVPWGYYLHYLARPGRQDFQLVGGLTANVAAQRHDGGEHNAGQSTFITIEREC